MRIAREQARTRQPWRTEKHEANRSRSYGAAGYIVNGTVLRDMSSVPLSSHRTKIGRFVVQPGAKGCAVLETEKKDRAAAAILARLSDLENYPEEALAPYEEFKVNEAIYYFTPGGFLYRKDPDTEALGGCFCGYLTDEVWHYRADDS